MRILSIFLAAVVIVLTFLYVHSISIQPVREQSVVTTQLDTAATVSTAVEWSCNGHVAFGLPGRENQLLCREGYAVGYDYERKVPSWVAYHITKESVEKKYKRSNKFTVDTELPENSRATLADYKGSGYDRGHMAPAATVDFSEEAMQESFLLSNMTPQLPGFNRQGWKYLETYVRDWAEMRGDLYVVTGALFEDGVATVGDHVNIPSDFYKVIFAPDQRDAIAFIVPHRKITKVDLPGFIVTIDQIEQRTGLDFISVLTDDVEAKIEGNAASMW